MHHAFLYISLPLFLHDYDVNMPNFAFYGGREKAKMKCYFSLGLELDRAPRNSTPGGLAYI